MNLMGKYQLWHVPKKIKETWKLYAMKTPDVSAEICNWGVWVGPESVRRLYEIGHGSSVKGGMFEHHLTTYVIQVAKDMKSNVDFTPTSASSAMLEIKNVTVE